MKSFFQPPWLLGCFLIALLPLNANAVAVSTYGSGEALIVPYFTVEGGNSTVISIANERSIPQAAKLIIRDDFGETVLSLNAYIEPYGSLVMSLSESDSSTTLAIPDQTCTAPATDDLDTSALSSATTGFVEVIAMGAFDLSVGDPLVNAAIRQECDVLEAAWQAGGAWSADPTFALIPPENGLQASSSVINVTRGTQFAMPATALTDFSNIVQHTGPTFDTPDLTSAHDSGTPNGATVSLNCFARRTGCISTEWSSPIDAVAAALIAEAGTAEFSIEQSLDAKAEVMFMFPLRRHYIKRLDERPESELGRFFPGDALAYADLGASIFDRNGVSEHPEPECPPMVGGSMLPPWCGDAYRRTNTFTNDRSVVSVFSFNATTEEAGEDIKTPILGATSRAFFPSAQYPNIPESGSGLFMMLNPSEGARLTSNSGENFPGVPFIGFVFQEVRNGTLVDEATDQPVRANYGTSFRVTVSHPGFLPR